MSASTPEGKVKAKIDVILKPYKASGQLWYFKPSASQFGRAGVPDYVCNLQALYYGDPHEPPSRDGRSIFFTIEAKAGKGKPSDLQNAQMEAIEKSGGICLVINETNLSELEEFLRAHS
jgi:hypothetical protein